MNLKAKKNLGQNFLNAPSVVKRMVHLSSVSEGDIVVEIGPGKGVLTKELLAAGACVWAYELDPRMIAYLNERFNQELHQGKLKLFHTDILDIDIDEVFKGVSYKLIANIPYYITNAIFRAFLETNQQPNTMCILLQKEVAERIARDDKESILSLSIKAYGTPSYITKVPRRYFNPIPKVDSALILVSDISHKKFINPEHEHLFFKRVKQGFAHKRKQLASNLSDKVKDKAYWQELLVNHGYPISVRAQELSLEDWLSLSLC